MTKKNEALLVIILAFLTGLICYYPSITIQDNIQSNTALSEKYVYSPLVSNYQGLIQDQVHYAGIIRNVADGSFKTSDVHIWEHRNDAGPLGKLPYIIGGWMVRGLGSINAFFSLKNFIFPFFSILCGYFFLRKFLNSTVVATWGVVLLLSKYCGTQLVNIALFRFQSAFPNGFLHPLSVFAEKYPSYQLVFPFTFLFYYCAYLLMKKNNNMYCFLTGLLAGLSFYLYFYSYLSVGMQFFFLMVWFFLHGKRALAFRFFMAGVIGLLIGSIYLKGMVSFMGSEANVSKSLAIGLSTGITYNLSKDGMELLVCCLLLLFLMKKLKNISDEVGFIFSIGVPVYIVMVLSTLFLFIPETQHFHTFELRNALFLSLLLFLSRVLNRNKAKRLLSFQAFKVFSKSSNLFSLARMIIVVGIVVNTTQILASELYYLHNRASLYPHRFILNRDTKAAYAWLNERAQKDKVVLSLDPEQINLIPVYTGMYTYLPDLIIGMSSIHEVFQRVKQSFGFYGIKGETLDEILSFEGTQGVLEDLKAEDGIKEFEKKHFEFKKRRFLSLVSAAHFDFSVGGLNFSHYKKYFSAEELNHLYKNRGRVFIPEKLKSTEMGDYLPDSGNAGQLQFAAHYVWYGPFEKELSGKKELESNSILLVYENPSVKIYKIKGRS